MSQANRGVSKTELIVGGLLLVAVAYFGGRSTTNTTVQLFASLFEIIGFVLFLRGVGLKWSRKEK